MTFSPTEQIVAKRLTERGYRLYRTGWPDFLIVHETKGHVLAVEVKSKHTRPLAHQKAVHELLRRAGLRVLIINPEKPWSPPLTKSEVSASAKALAERPRGPRSKSRKPFYR